MYQQERFQLPASLLSMSMDGLFGEASNPGKNSGQKRKRQESDAAPQNDGGG